MFYQRLHEICKEKGTSVTKMTKELGLSSGNLTNWKNGRLPKTEIAMKIADYLGVSLHYLMGETDQKEKPSIDSDERLQKLYDVVKDLSDAEYMAFMSFVAGLKANRPQD